MNPRRLLAAALLSAAAATALVYGRSLPYDFVYDDLWTVVRNPALRQAGPLGFLTDASTAADPSSGIGDTVYRPLPTMTFALNLRAAGLRPWAWRLPDLALHALNGTLLFLLLLRLGLSAGGAALGAAVFLLHPVQTESAVWITQRSNLLCAAGGLGALLLFSRGSAWGLAAFAAALLSKETAVTLTPFLFLAAALGPADRQKKAALAAGALLLVAGLLAARWAAVGGLAQRAWRGGFVENFLIGQASWLEYVKLLAWPARLSASHWQYVDDPWTHPAPWAGLALGAAWAFGAAFLVRRGAPRAALALLWVAATLSPHLGLLPMDTFVGERFLYLPLAGAAALAALAWDALPKRAARALWTAPVLLACLSFRRTADWESDLALWRSAVRAEPRNPFARLALAEAHYARGQRAEAVQTTREALTLLPSRHMAFAGLNNLSEAALAEGRPGAALRFADRALRIQPESPAARLNREKALRALPPQKRKAPR